MDEQLTLSPLPYETPLGMLIPLIRAEAVMAEMAETMMIDLNILFGSVRSICIGSDVRCGVVSSRPKI